MAGGLDLIPTQEGARIQAQLLAGPRFTKRSHARGIDPAGRPSNLSMTTPAEAPPVFASLASPQVLAPLFVGVCSLAMVIEGMVAAGGMFFFASLVFLFPAITAALAASVAAGSQWGRAFAAAAIGASVQAAAGVAICLMIPGPRIEVFAIVILMAVATTCAAAVVALPLIIAAGVIGGRRDLAAGDAMLAAGGIWLVLTQLVKMAFMPEYAMGFVPAIAIGGIAIGVHVARGFVRRSWAAKVARGEVPGWRVRVTAPDEIATLPPLFPASLRRGSVTAVLERIVVGGAVYRSCLVAEPIASVTARPTFRL